MYQESCCIRGQTNLSTPLVGRYIPKRIFNNSPFIDQIVEALIGRDLICVPTVAEEHIEIIRYDKMSRYSFIVQFSISMRQWVSDKCHFYRDIEKMTVVVIGNYDRYSELIRLRVISVIFHNTLADLAFRHGCTDWNLAHHYDLWGWREEVFILQVFAELRFQERPFERSGPDALEIFWFRKYLRLDSKLVLRVIG